MIVAAVEAPPRNETFHLVHHDPVRLRDSLSWSLDHLKVEGVAVCDTQVAKDIAMKAQTPLVHRLQRRIDVVHDAYVPYCTMEPRSQMEAASRHLCEGTWAIDVTGLSLRSQIAGYQIPHPTYS